MTKSLVVIEPHADDAFLSLGAHIELWAKEGRKVTIVTVFPQVDLFRGRNAEAAAYARAVGAEWVGLDLAVGSLPATRPKLPSGQILLPVGIQNPDHQAVRTYFEGRGSQYYLDQPYAMIQKNSAEVEAKLAGSKFVSFLAPGARKYRHIPIFKSQAKFFHFNPAERLRGAAELIVRF